MLQNWKKGSISKEKFNLYQVQINIIKFQQLSINNYGTQQKKGDRGNMSVDYVLLGLGLQDTWLS